MQTQMQENGLAEGNPLFAAGIENKQTGSPKENVQKRHWSSENSPHIIQDADLEADDTIVQNRAGPGANCVESRRGGAPEGNPVEMGGTDRAVQEATRVGRSSDEIMQAVLDVLGGLAGSRRTEPDGTGRAGAGPD